MRVGSGFTVAALCKHKDLDIHLRNWLGEMALDIFVELGNARPIEELAKHPLSNVNQRNRWRETPLITAVRLRQVEVVEVLLRILSVYLEACDEDGLSAPEVADRLDHGPDK